MRKINHKKSLEIIRKCVQCGKPFKTIVASKNKNLHNLICNECFNKAINQGFIINAITRLRHKDY